MWVCASSLLGHAHSDAITEVQHERDQIERGVVSVPISCKGVSLP